MGVYDLPTSLEIGEVSFSIRYGWRAVMDIFAAYADPELDDEMKTETMLQILYPDWDKIRPEHIQEAVEKACDFLDCGMKPDKQHRPRTMDWEQDAVIIIPAVNSVAGQEIRFAPDIHWWTFFGWYMSISDSLFSSVINKIQKKSNVKKQEK